MAPDVESAHPGAGPVPVGVSFTPFESRVEVIERVAVHADASGIAFVSVAEAMSLAAPIVLARLAATTRRTGLMTGVLSVWGRSPATLALTAAELQRLSGGRFVLGLGAGTAPITEGFHGRPWSSPLAELERVCRSTGALLRGERMPDAVDGARPLALQCPPPAPVPLALAAVTMPSIRLAGAVADQWLPFLLPAAALDEGRAELARSAAQHDRAAPTVTACVPLAIAADERGAERLAAQWLLAYTTRMGPVYPRVLREHGYGPEIDALLAANDDPREPVLPSHARRLAEDVLLLGTHEEAPVLCRRWAEHADAIALVLPFASAEDDLLAVVDATAPGPGAAAS